MSSAGHKLDNEVRNLSRPSFWLWTHGERWVYAQSILSFRSLVMHKFVYFVIV